MPASTETAIHRLDELGAISDSADFRVRTFLSPASRRAAGRILDWMSDLGMEICHTADGTLRGILPGRDSLAAPLLLGSHYDTVVDAGKYDGPLGIIAALAALETLREENVMLPFPVHVLAFSDEEGTRFQTTYLGSSGIIAQLDPASFAARDGDGITIAEAIAREGWNEGAAEIRYAPGECRGYVELHIEQGRVLEEAGEPAGVVSGIAGQSRLTVVLTGRADHAGTTPMPLRRDALTGAAECVLAAESQARSNPPLVITVGKISVHPGASNSIPQTAIFTVDLRHPADAARRDFLADLHETFAAIAHGRGLALNWRVIQDNNATPCDQGLTQQLADALEATTGSRLTLASGAGHDGVVVSRICPIAMLFTRCRDGLSHHPDEFATAADIGVGIAVLTRFLKSFPPGSSCGAVEGAFPE